MEERSCVQCKFHLKCHDRILLEEFLQQAKYLAQTAKEAAECGTPANVTHLRQALADACTIHPG